MSDSSAVETAPADTNVLIAPETAEEPPGGVPEEVSRPRGHRARPRRRRRPNYLGLVGAVLGLGAALTPSLLPRPTSLEGVVAGIGAVLGYGVGVFVSWLLRKLLDREPRPAVKRWAWILLAFLGPLATVLLLVQGARWQDEVRTLVGQSAQSWSATLVVAAIALPIAFVVLAAARGLRRLAGWFAGKAGRVVPRPLARVVGVLVVVVLVGWLASGLAVNAFMHLADKVYSAENDTTPAGAATPAAPERSGSPASLVSWASLGKQGRAFVGRGPTVAQLTQFSGATAMEPIRVYVGLESAPDARARAALAVKELIRTGAFTRKVLVVAGTTGTGWLEPQSVDSIEFEWNGDTAIVGIQYSYLPSWISTLVDAQRAADAGRELFDAVYAQWSTLPADTRPRLIAYGLSLGSFSIQSAFASAGDVVSRTDGAIFVGSPSFSQPWGTITRTRDAGSPEWQPVYRQGENLRFIGTPPDLGNLKSQWYDPHVLYVQHADDPVVWWNPALISSRPDWLREPPGPARTSSMHWFPMITFLQVTVDQFVGVSVPDGFGHNYGSTMPSAWAAVVPAPGWTQSDTDRLTKLISGYAIE